MSRRAAGIPLEPGPAPERRSSPIHGRSQRRAPDRHPRLRPGRVVAAWLALVVPLAAGCATTAVDDRALERSRLVARPDTGQVQPHRPSPRAVEEAAAVAAVARADPPSTEPAPAPPAPGEVAAAPDPAPAPASPPPVVNRPPERPDRSATGPGGTTEPQAAESTAVHPADFPDPFVLRANGAWWAFSTQIGLASVPMMRSTDLLRWEVAGDGDALAGVPAWADWGHSWAPSVLARPSTFVLYYTTRHRATGLQCISRAVALLPQGPYDDDSTGPLVCQTRRGGSIDPSPFVDADGTPWLLWKSEGTLLGEPTRIWVQALSDDGLRRVGNPVQLLERAMPWEEPIIEGPSMALIGGRHHLFYSGNRWETARYAVGHALCETVTGPCRRTSSGPVLHSRPGEAGPGGQEVLHVDGHGPLLVHHAWDPAAVGYPHGARRLHLSELHADGDVVRAGGPWRGEARADLVADVTGPRTRSDGGLFGRAGAARTHN